MLRKIGVAILIFIASTNVFAEAFPYVGIEFGLDMPNWTLKDISGTNVHFSNPGAVGNLLLGFGGMITPVFYGAIEGSAGEDSTRSSTKNINVTGGAATAMIRARYSYGGSFIPALQVNWAVRVYARLGVIRTRYILHQSVVPVGSGTNLSQNTVTGGQLGIGIQSDVARALAIRAEYDYTAYRSFWAFDNRIVAKDNLFKIGLVYCIS